ncbi:MAG: RecB family exonuclease [Anaerolineaceae bacterium]
MVLHGTDSGRKVSISGSIHLPNGIKNWRQSPFSLRLSHPEISEDPNLLPDGLVHSTPSPRVDETIVPTTYSDIRYYLRCPRDYQFRKSFGFSPPVPELFGFGKTVHTSIEKLHEMFLRRTPTADEADEVVDTTFHLKHVFPSRDPQNRPGPYERAKEIAKTIARTYVENFSEDFLLQREIEVRFEIPVVQAVIAGSIDLILKQDDQGNIIDSNVIDFKSIEGGETPEENDALHWTELALQVQLYAKASRDVLGENTRTGSVHLLKDNLRINVPISDVAVDSAVANVEWAVERIIQGDFPMRPERDKCLKCDFIALCPKIPQPFTTTNTPPPIFIPGDSGQNMARAFSEFDDDGHN